MHELDISAPSPNGEHVAVLSYENEIRFGPSYYSLEIDDFRFMGRTFGEDYLWSPDSRYFAIQEWRTTSEKDGPNTQLLLLDAIDRRECILSGAYKGWIKPRFFEGDKLIYTKWLTPGIIKEFEIEFLTLDRWVKMEKRGTRRRLP